jgi:hypothetical protein
MTSRLLSMMKQVKQLDEVMAQVLTDPHYRAQPRLVPALSPQGQQMT